MADDLFEAREANYMDSLGGRVSGVVVPLAAAHLEMQRRYAMDVAKTLTDQVPVKVGLDLEGKRYELNVWIPLLLIAGVRPLDYDEGTGIKTRMTVSAEKSKSTEVGSKVEAGVQAGWGPVSASFKAEVSVDHKEGQSSGYESSVEVEVKLISREETPMVATLRQIIGDFVRAHVTQMVNSIQAGDVEAIGDAPEVPALPEPSPEKAAAE